MLPGMLAVFAEFERKILREHVKAGIAQARARGQSHGRPPTVKARSAEIKRLFARGLSKREIAKRLKVGRTSDLFTEWLMSGKDLSKIGGPETAR
jgi:DNA invertase Pin-like site-specific DNA recombinase